MEGERRRRILALIVDRGPLDLETERLCEVAAAVTRTSGAEIMLISGDMPRGAVCATDEVSALLEQLQYALGEGPCVDASHQDRPVLEPDLARPRTPRWLAFSGPALDAGVRAVFGFPLCLGAVRLGALGLHRDRPGPLTDDQHADALVVADIATRAVLLLQVGAPPGRLAAELEAGANFHYVVHQASGMVAAQLDISVGQAVIRLRAHAFGNDRSLTDVARDVTARRLRFDARTGEADPQP
jgi:hypothetical protein